MLDIGLPGINGIEVARRIRTRVPQCKIVFLTQENSAEVVEEAFRLGARGYVIKSRAESELLSAVEAVREGGHFIGSSVVLPLPADAGAEQCIPDIPGRKSLPLKPDQAQATRSHVVEFDSDDPSFLSGFARFVEDALNGGRRGYRDHDRGLL